MRRPMVVWLAGIGSLVVLDIWCDRNDTPGDSLSECVRLLVHQPQSHLGRVAFLGGWLSLAVWFPLHILRRTDLGELEAHLKAHTF